MCALVSLLSVPSIFLLTEVNLIFTLSLSKGFFLLGRSMLACNQHDWKHKGWSIPVSWRDWGATSGGASCHTTQMIPPQGEHYRCNSRCPPKPSIAFPCSGEVLQVLATEVTIASRFFSVAKNYHSKNTYSYSF